MVSGGQVHCRWRQPELCQCLLLIPSISTTVGLSFCWPAPANLPFLSPITRGIVMWKSILRDQDKYIRFISLVAYSAFHNWEAWLWNIMCSRCCSNKIKPYPNSQKSQLMCLPAGGWAAKTLASLPPLFWRSLCAVLSWDSSPCSIHIKKSTKTILGKARQKYVLLFWCCPDVFPSAQ